MHEGFYETSPHAGKLSRRIHLDLPGLFLSSIENREHNCTGDKANQDMPPIDQ